MYPVIILAGGLGTRLKSVVNNRPKPMALINNRPFLEYLMNYWINQNIERFIISTGYLGHQIKDHFGNCFNGIKIDYNHETTLLGTGGAIIDVINKFKIKNNFIVINGDTLFKVKLEKMVNDMINYQADCCIASKELSFNKRYNYLEIDDQNKVVNFISTNKNQSLINGGTYLLKVSLFQKFLNSENKIISLEKDIFPTILLDNTKKIIVSKFESFFIDIGVPNDFKKAKLLIN